MSNNGIRRHRQNLYSLIREHLDFCLNKKVSYKDITKLFIYLHNWEELDRVKQYCL